MIWTPESLATLKSLRDHASDSPAQLNTDAYRRVLAEADPLARIDELEGRTCLTCEHQHETGDWDTWCYSLTTLARGKYPIYCKDVGNTCGAWKAR